MNARPLDCNQAKDWILDGLKGNLPAAEQAALDAHISSCEQCQKDLDHARQVSQWLQTDPTPEPSLRMQTKFYDMLYSLGEVNSEEIPKTSASPVTKFKFRTNPTVWLQIAATVLLVGCGMITGYWLRSQTPRDQVAQAQIDTMAVQIQQMRQMMMLTLLENPSASERLQAVSLSNELDHADQQVIDALLTTLSYDTNVNVRLVTLNALIKYTDSPYVREGLIQSLPYQNSPLVQMALADLMVKLQEKRSIKALRGLLQQKGIRSPAKAKIEQSIIQLS
ncbi:zf-HC2 domain-containing protein [Dyadobacter aurulentus]|uniref:zf-HC2 domain-containing protein n=1 Tax=Dyadobacter sp. UC 10 TaxID=2605428 RepID=UPI0011F22B78|nr:zf-HC2 domain-containing protein [Dyadobacter sp. UC 10]KAA0992677.1 HEAT repeat domain-containing protein [Dyadobacter sp. UC 10]